MNTRRQWIAFDTLVRKEVIRFMRIWPQTLLPPLINQSLYFVIFGGFIGSQISGINGVSYMEFIIPGLMMMGVINNAFSNVVSSFFGSKFQRNVEEMMVSPISDVVILAGYTVGGMLRGLLVGLLIFGMSLFFVHPTVDHPVFVLLFALLTALVFSLAGFLNGLLAKKFDDVSLFQTFILTPLTYFGGVFYSIDRFPVVWQWVSKLNPILYMVDGFRYGFYGFSDVNVWVSLSFLLGFAVILGGLDLWMLKKGYGLKT